jgi:tetratricopeptide (TPR) repeat protein
MTTEKLEDKAEDLLSTEHYEDALRVLDELIEIERKGPNHPKFLLSALLRKAEALLALERHKEAYRVLVIETPETARGREQTEERYWRMLAEAGELTGHGAEARKARQTAQELSLDWAASLERAEELRNAGRDEESLAFYDRSLRMNPGELGTQGDLEKAVFGKVRALLALARKPEAKHLLAKPWINASSLEYQKLLEEVSGP